jgi:hypothetical protein
MTYNLEFLLIRQDISLGQANKPTRFLSFANRKKVSSGEYPRDQEVQMLGDIASSEGRGRYTSGGNDRRGVGSAVPGGIYASLARRPFRTPVPTSFSASSWSHDNVPEIRMSEAQVEAFEKERRPSRNGSTAGAQSAEIQRMTDLAPELFRREIQPPPALPKAKRPAIMVSISFRISSNDLFRMKQKPYDEHPSGDVTVFTHDVFISHSAKDKAVVRALAERLKADGLRVWFDEWERPVASVSDRRDDSRRSESAATAAKIEEGLEHSRVLVLCMSANSFGSEWAQLEAGMFRFRDPLNKERRFIPLRLDNAPIKGSLAQFLYINWLPADREHEYAKLLEACRPPAKPKTSQRRAVHRRRAEHDVQLDSAGPILGYAFSPDGKRAVTGSANKTVQLWDVETGGCLHLFEGHQDAG